MNTQTYSLLRIILGLTIAISASSGVSGGVIVSNQIDTTFGTNSAPIGVYDTASASVFIDPANTNWMALSIGTALRTDLPNLAGIPTIQSTQMDDAILLTASIGSFTSSTITLDNNGAFNERIGNQAIFYGYFNSVGSFNGFTIGTYGAQAETGALTSFFDAHGAGTYSLNVQYVNKYTSSAGHGNVFLLRDINPTREVPEPASIALFGFGTLGMGFIAFRRRQKLEPAA